MIANNAKNYKALRFASAVLSSKENLNYQKMYVGYKQKSW